MRAFSGKTPGDGKTNAAGGAGDESCFVVESFQFVSFFLNAEALRRREYEVKLCATVSRRSSHFKNLFH